MKKYDLLIFNCTLCKLAVFVTKGNEDGSLTFSDNAYALVVEFCSLNTYRLHLLILSNRNKHGYVQTLSETPSYRLSREEGNLLFLKAQFGSLKMNISYSAGFTIKCLSRIQAEMNGKHRPSIEKC